MYPLYSGAHLEQQASDGVFKNPNPQFSAEADGASATWRHTPSDFPAHCDYSFTSLKDRLIDSSQGERRGW